MSSESVKGGTRMTCGGRSTSWRGLTTLGMLGMLLMAACTSETGSEDPPSTTPAAPDPTVFTAPPDGGEIRVVESGMSVWSDESSGLVSYGAIIENTSGTVAHRIPVSLWLLDAEGDRIPGSTGHDWGGLVVAQLLPGQRLGIGDTNVLSEDEQAADLEVVIEEPDEWQTLDETVFYHHPVIASDVTTERTERGATLSATVDATYTFETLVPGSAGIRGNFVPIFRNSEGRIVGADECCERFIPPGSFREALDFAVPPPPEADDARTELYVVPFV
jgi:hypothetical protein